MRSRSLALTAAHPGRLDPGIEAWLRDGASWGDACEQVIETSISWVFLYPSRVLKLKKPVDMGFLDFTTPEKRRWAVLRELAFNRSAAPDIYRAVHWISGDPDGSLSLDGPGKPLDWAVEMRRFPESAVLRGHPETVRDGFAETLGRIIARRHADAEPGVVGGGSVGLGYVIGSNAEQLRALAEVLGPDQIEPLIAETDLAAARLAALLDRRLTAGFVRCCHGDLHLGNILMENGQAVLFDCIDFNDALREIDVLYDLAFLLMDLNFRDVRDGANRVLNGWLDEAARQFGEGVWEGLAALSLFTAMRATIRAHVCGHEGDAATARRYLASARRSLAPTPCALIAIGGVSGSGKTTVARALAPRLSGPTGAVVLRSDEIRKRLWGRRSTEALPPDAYTPEAGDRVYAAMFQSARQCLAAGCTVIIDAAFLAAETRAEIEALTVDAGAPFHGAWLNASADVLRRRVDSRENDASDADATVLESQLRRDPGPVAWRRFNSDDAATIAAQLRTWVDGAIEPPYLLKAPPSAGATS